MKQAEIQRLLPEIFQRAIRPQSSLYAILSVMELLQAPSEDLLQNLEINFDPRRAPDEFVPYLAGWVDLDRLLTVAPGQADPATLPTFPTGTGRLRELLAAAPYLSRWRGTNRGLIAFLEIATGQTGFSIEEQVPGPAGQPQPFHLRVQAPQLDKTARALVERIVELEKPVYVTFEMAYPDPDQDTSAAPPTPATGANPASAPPTTTPVVPPGQPLATGPANPTSQPGGPNPAAGSPPVTAVSPVFRPRLVAAATGQSLGLPPRPSMVGRSASNDTTKPEIDLTGVDTTRTVSRRHALITFDHGNFFLTEQPNVANGTFINGQRLTPQVPAPLHEGDRVRFGQFEMIFQVA